MQHTNGYYIFYNIVSELCRKITSQRISLWCTDRKLKPCGCPRKAKTRVDHHDISCCKSWWDLWCLNLAWACKGKAKVTTASGVLQPAFPRWYTYTGTCWWQLQVPVLSLWDNLDTVETVKHERMWKQKWLKKSPPLLFLGHLAEPQH